MLSAGVLPLQNKGSFFTFTHFSHIYFIHVLIDFSIVNAVTSEFCQQARFAALIIFYLQLANHQTLLSKVKILILGLFVQGFFLVVLLKSAQKSL